MSVWGDIRKRSNGEARRKENEIFVEPNETNITEAISFVGNINQELSKKIGHKQGNLYIVQDTCSIDGIVYYPGEMLLDDGKKFNLVSKSEYIGE